MVEGPQLPRHPACPHCGGHETQLMHTFGSVLANAQFYCDDCRTPFELVKWRSGDEAPINP